MENNSPEKVVTPNFSPQYYGILDFDPDTAKEAPRFTEPATLEAMVNLGIISSDLVPAKISDFEGQDPVVFNEIKEELEKRRLATIQKIIAERNAVIKRMHGTNFPVQESSKETRENKKKERKIKGRKKKINKEEQQPNKENKENEGQQEITQNNQKQENSNYNDAEMSLEQKLLQITAKYNKPIVSDTSLPPSSLGSLSSNHDSNDELEEQQQEQEQENDNENDDNLNNNNDKEQSIEHHDSLIINNLNKSINKNEEEQEKKPTKQTKAKKKHRKKKKSKAKNNNEQTLKPSKIPVPNLRRKKKRAPQTIYDDSKMDTNRRQDRISLMEFRKRRAYETKEKAEELKRRNALRALARVDAIEQRQNEMRQRQQELIKEKARQRMRRLAKLEQQNEEKWNRKKADEQNEMLRQERIYQKIKDRGRKKFEEQRRWRMKNIYGQSSLKKFPSFESRESNKPSENHIASLRKKLISSKLSLLSQESQESHETQNLAPQSILQPIAKPPPPPQRLVKKQKVSIYKPRGIAKNTSKEKGLTYHSRLPPSNNKPLVPDKGSRIPYFRPR